MEKQDKFEQALEKQKKLEEQNQRGTKVCPACGKERYTVEGGFDWLAYKAQVAAWSLPPIYEEAKCAARESRGIRSAKDVASEDAIEMAVDMAEKLEKRLKGGK